MPAIIDSLTTSTLSLRMAIALARAVPPRLGYAIAGTMGELLASRRESGQVRAVRLNQRIVAGEDASPEMLDQSVIRVFQHSANAIYELYHYLKHPQEADDLLVLEPSFQALIDRSEFCERGLVICGLHMRGFDLVMQWVCRQKWLNPLILTLPNPQGGQQVEFEIRRQTGMDLVPGDLSGLRRAIRQLNQGGIVATGLDHPMEGNGLRPRFFGRPACLPTHHVSLALRTHSPVMVVACRYEQDRKYHVFSAGPFEMDPYPDHKDELMYNTEKLLAAAESIIRQTPEQWGVFKPIWPDFGDPVPFPPRLTLNQEGND